MPEGVINLSKYKCLVCNQNRLVPLTDSWQCEGCGEKYATVKGIPRLYLERLACLRAHRSVPIRARRPLSELLFFFQSLAHAFAARRIINPSVPWRGLFSAATQISSLSLSAGDTRQNLTAVHALPAG